MNWMQARIQDGATCHQLFPGGGGMSQLMNRFLFHNLFSKYFFKYFPGMSQGFSVTFHLFPSVSGMMQLVFLFQAFSNLCQDSRYNVHCTRPELS